MTRPLSLQAALPLIAGLSVILVGCASTASESVKEEVTRTEATVQQIAQSGATRDAGGIELEQAKDKTAQARRAMDKGDEKDALRLAEQARLDADLAQAKARSYTAQKSAEEVRMSIEQLRREAQRSTGSGDTTSPAATPTTPGPTSVPSTPTPAPTPEVAPSSTSDSRM